MSKEIENKAIVGRWFTEFWGKNCDPQNRRRTRSARHAAAIFTARAAPRPRGYLSVHDRVSRSVSGPEFLGHGRSYRRGRLCGWPKGGWRHTHRSGFQRLSHRIIAGGDWT